MKSPVTWTVGRRLAAIAGIGAITVVVVGGVALSGIRTLDAHATELAAYEDARSLMHALDTRSSELKVDGLKALTVPDNSTMPQDVVDDTAKIADLLDQLAALDLSVTAEQEQTFDAAWARYEERIAEFVDAAVADRAAMLPKADKVQKANDAMDELLGAAVDAMEASAAAKQQEADETRSSVTSLVVLAAVLGLVTLVALAFVIARSITRPLRSSVDVLEAFADGDLTQRAPERSTAELGELERALNRSIDSVGQIITSVTGSAD
ncbi:HAMP domain-containing protein, partial [Nocardioides sp. PD653-B2]